MKEKKGGRIGKSEVYESQTMGWVESNIGFS